MIRKSIYSVFALLILIGNLPALLGAPGHSGSVEAIVQEPTDPGSSVAETDLERVNWRLNMFPNPGLEKWEEPRTPSYFTTTRSFERFIVFATDVVYEGAKSARMYARAVDSNYPAVAYMTQSAWTWWDNPTNLTLSFWWFLESLPNPVDYDSFRVVVNLDGRSITYYLGCEVTQTNTTSHGYIMVDGPTGIWNQLDRNITRDYIEIFGFSPVQFRNFYVYLTALSNEIASVYVDDFWLVNGTTVKIGGSVNNGNFEAGGSWFFPSPSGAGDIAQSTVRVEGDWSMNLTANAYDHGYPANARAEVEIHRRFAELNPDIFSFSWRIEDLTAASANTYAYVRVDYDNSTESNYVYYLLSYGGETGPNVNFGDALVIEVDNFNTTGEWVSFNRSIWEDVTSSHSSDEVHVNDIQFYVYTRYADARLSILIDNISLLCSGINDMSYEDQGPVGSEVSRWSGAGQHLFTITDFAHTGSKAANLTLFDADSASYTQLMPFLPINSERELILDIWWHLLEFNLASEDYAALILEFDDSNLALVIANGTESFSGEYSFTIAVLPTTNTVGEWVNWQLDIHHIATQVLGEHEDRVLERIQLEALVSYDSLMTLFLDDFYMYEDASPAISNIMQSQSPPEAGTSVTISAEILDATEVTGTLHYRLDSGAWTNLTMDASTGGTYEAIIPDVAWNVTTEYFVSAIDAYDKQTIGLNGSAYFSFVAVDTIAPTVSVDVPGINGTLSGVVAISISANDSGSGIALVQVFLNDTSIANRTSMPYGLDLDTTQLANGTYELRVVAHDNAGNTAQETVTMTIANFEDTISPTIDSPSDIQYELGTVGHSITWSPFDLHPSRYEIYRNGSLIDYDEWDGSQILINVDGLSVGTYNYTLIVYDTSENWSSHTVFVTVVETTQPTTPDDTTTPDTTTPIQLPDDYTAILVIIALAIVVACVVVFVVYPKMKK